jgi:hypothetical protein
MSESTPFRQHLLPLAPRLLQAREDESSGALDSAPVTQPDDDGSRRLPPSNDALQRRPHIVREHAVDQRPLEVHHGPEPGDVRRVESEGRRAARVALRDLLTVGVVLHLEHAQIPLVDLSIAVPIHPPARHAQIEREVGILGGLGQVRLDALHSPVRVGEHHVKEPSADDAPAHEPAAHKAHEDGEPFRHQIVQRLAELGDSPYRMRGGVAVILLEHRSGLAQRVFETSLLKRLHCGRGGLEMAGASGIVPGNRPGLGGGTAGQHHHGKDGGWHTRHGAETSGSGVITPSASGAPRVVWPGEASVPAGHARARVKAGAQPYAALCTLVPGHAERPSNREPRHRR